MKNLDDFKDLINLVEYNKDWSIHVHQPAGTAAPYLQVRFKAPDAETGEEKMQHCRKWQLSPHMTDTEVVVTAFKAILAAEEHECRENFKFNGKQVFSPHLNIWDLVEAIDTKSVEFDEREKQ